MKKFRVKRNRRGQGIIEGAIGLIMVLGAGIAATLLLLNSGAGMYFKQKLMPVAYLGAQFAAGHSADPNVSDETRQYIEQLMPKVGLKPANLGVDVLLITVEDEPSIQVTVTNNFPLFGNGSDITGVLRLSGTEVVSW